ncbi:Omp28-related outer membrane protein [Lacibacter sediminis]|uniref:Omp28-related outer membrane protein n=1 Tax=Lacibacter sediminis TaxID=2760713 RepID=A0A7G5XH85_9BACT|nr:Omp28-related outer membrane protein [Lacibacter sediminis]QNA44838.1 Omp28-related outer membrane protein [Lacibacter sediminis]
MYHTNSFFALVIILVLASCSKPGNEPDLVTQPQPLTVQLSRNELAADGFDEVSITVKDQSNADVTSSSTIYLNNTVYNSTTFFTNTSGNYQIKATRGSATSSTVTLTANTPGPSAFTQKVLIEDFTGTWCGICPGTVIPLDAYTDTKPNLISVGVHGPAGSNDPFKYIYDSQLRTALGVTGVPTVILNRDTKWDNNTATLDALAQKRAVLGLALETSVSGTMVNVKARVKFDVTTSLPLKIVVLLAEDSLLYNQANYGHFGLPNPIPNFRQKNVLRTAATDIFGDNIPVASSTKANTWEKDYSFNATGYNMSNIKVIAFVLFDTNTQNRKGVLNVQVAKAGENKNFD